MPLIYKIMPATMWRDAVSAGAFTGAPVDHADGFIHFSAADQVRATAAKHFAGHRDLVLVAVTAEALGSALKWEVSRGGALFPHLYAPLVITQDVLVEPLPLGADGLHVFPEAIP
ncbi:MAG TPA: DUF952 domain-containing protein [Beijerinckiaceae bacterium]|mgnify:CR=1 FL=1|nr:DUF952 domain-containing protein [Beijerinckiaceae bacterium]